MHCHLCILILIPILSITCYSLKSLLCYWLPVMVSDHGHPHFRNFNSIIFIDIIRMKFREQYLILRKTQSLNKLFLACILHQIKKNAALQAVPLKVFGVCTTSEFLKITSNFTSCFLLDALYLYLKIKNRFNWVSFYFFCWFFKKNAWKTKRNRSGCQPQNLENELCWAQGQGHWTDLSWYFQTFG